SALRLAEGQATETRSTKVYVVQMAAKPGISYEGGAAGFARTAPETGAKYDARSSQVQMYTEHLVAQQDSLLAAIGARGRKIYSYRHALNGFAARLTAAEAATLRKNKAVLNVWEDRKLRIDTNNSPQFLGLLDPKNGLRTKHGLRGKGIIIGMLDTGAVQEHPSFDDTGFDPPANWNGVCQSGEGWNANDCNNKLIGARYFISGFGAGNATPGEFISTRDSDGHGTHTATTAAGREVTASLAGTPLAQISGMAPDAYVAIYKVCWAAPNPDDSGCFFSDSAAATDAAVADGVDLLSFSVGTAAAFNDPQDIAFLNAVDAGVFVSRSAGNEGPGPATTAAGEPWSMSVGASTHSGTAFALALRVNSPASIAGDYPALEGAITKPLAETGPITNDVVAANPIDACTPIAAIGGKIALIARGVCTFDVKLTNAVNAGAGAVIVYTSPATNPKVVMGGNLSFDIPGVMIDNAPGLAILAELTGGATVNATLSAGVFITEQLTGNIMAGFSSRGPYSTESDWIKPDVTAPGVRVLAGATPEPNDGSPGDFFQYLQGTSMSTPHVTGVAALLIEAHPDWTPAQIRSALMTTARQDVVKENGTTAADPFDFGAGHIVPNKAIDPGLTYDAGLFDYLAASCGTNTPLVSPADCGTLEGLGFSLDPANLNLPSIGVGELVGTRTVRRTVTNVGPTAKYQVGFKAPPGFKVQVNPKSFTLAQGQSASYEVSITNDRAPPDVWRFGRLEWKDNKGHVVRSPIAVNAKLIVAPADIAGTGANGATSFDVSFGYNGSYAPGAHGLESPFLSQDSVEDDPDNTFDFLGPGETLAYLLEIPAGTVYAQWSLFDAYTDGDHDLDAYLFYCPNLACTQVDVSLGATSEERVSVNFPLNDPAINDPYALIVHGFATERGGTAQFVLFDWTDPGVGQDLGNMTVSGPATAVIGQSGTVNVNWAGLATGAGAKQVGAVSHSDDTGIKGLTIVNIANDPGAGFCDLVDC
ncbi:MAG: S8 family serine peptidase, partial [Steroidobacteraceae bacterium]